MLTSKTFYRKTKGGNIYKVRFNPWKMNYLLMIEFPLKIFLLNSDCKRTLFTK